MNVLSVERISKRFGPKLLFEDLSFGLAKGQKTAIVARNGTGKSTLLKCIAGLETPDAGNITFTKGLRVGYLNQDVSMKATHSPIDEMLDRDDPVSNAIRTYEHLVAKNAQGPALQQAITRITELNAWDHEARVKRLLHQFGLHDLEQPVNTLSGGQQKRLAIAKVLIDLPDVLVLDEPTNHLDLPMIEQLEAELNVPNATLLIVTHDRSFLDNVCDEILELEFGSFTRYKGNYSYYVEKKAELEEVRDATQHRLRSLARKELEWVRKMPRARGTKSRSRLQAFDELSGLAKRKYTHDGVNLDIKSSRLGGKVIEVRNLTKSFGDKKIVAHFNYSIKAGDRIGIVGPNGVGKSTFINLLTKEEEPDLGKVTIGDTVVLGVFDQSGLPASEDKRVIEVVREIAEEIPMSKGRTLTAAQLLERFLFDKEKQYQYVSTLSGGERRRLYLCTVLMKNPNVLVLDEPTNDLDIPTLNALEDFLMDLEICLLIVSHDRFFLDKLCTKLLVFEGEGRVKEWVHSYTELRELERERERAGREEVKAVKEVKQRAPSAKMTYAERLELKKIEREMPKLEGKKEELMVEMAEKATDHHAVMELSIELEKLVSDLETMGDRWLQLMEKEEGAG